MNQSGREQMDNSENSDSARLAALIREHQERQRDNIGNGPPSLLEALLRANSANRDPGTSQQQLQRGQATPVRRPGAQQNMLSNQRGSSNSSSAAQGSDFVGGDASSSSSSSSSSSLDNHQLQRTLLVLSAQWEHEQRRQLERQDQQRQLEGRQQEGLISTGDPPRPQSFPPANSAALQAAGKSGNESTQQQLLQMQHIIMLLAQKQQEESNSRARGPQGVNESPTRGAPSGIDSAALLRILSRKQQQKSPRETQQRSFTDPSGANDTFLALDNSGNGALAGPDMASAVRRSALLVAAHARQQERMRQQQRVFQGRVSRRETTTPEGSTTVQQRAYLLELQRQAQQNRGSLLTNSAPQQHSSQSASLPAGSSQAETDAATSRFLKHNTSRVATTSRAASQLDQLLAVSTARRDEVAQALRSLQPAQAGRSADVVANESLTHPSMLMAASRILPLGAINRASFQGESRQNSSIHFSILQATRQGMVESDSSGEMKAEQDDRKRKVDDMEKQQQQESQGAAKKRAVKQPSVEVKSFPMPSLTCARNVHTSKLVSFRRLWYELEGSEMQEEIFRQRIYQDTKIVVGCSRTMKKKDGEM